MGLNVISKESRIRDKSATEISHVQFVHLYYTGDFSPANPCLPAGQGRIRNDMGWGVISKESPTEISHVQFVHLCYTGDFSPAKAGFEMTTLFIRFLTANGAGN